MSPPDVVTIGVPHVDCAHAEEDFEPDFNALPIMPTMGGVQHLTHYTKTGIRKVLAFKSLVEDIQDRHIGSFFHLMLTHAPNHLGVSIVECILYAELTRKCISKAINDVTTTEFEFEYQQDQICVFPAAPSDSELSAFWAAPKPVRKPPLGKIRMYD